MHPALCLITLDSICTTTSGQTGYIVQASFPYGGPDVTVPANASTGSSFTDYTTGAQVVLGEGVYDRLSTSGANVLLDDNGGNHNDLYGGSGDGTLITSGSYDLLPPANPSRRNSGAQKARDHSSARRSCQKRLGRPPLIHALDKSSQMRHSLQNDSTDVRTYSESQENKKILCRSFCEYTLMPPEGGLGASLWRRTVEHGGEKIGGRKHMGADLVCREKARKI